MNSHLDSLETNGKPVITTLVIGADYTDALQTCLQSKSEYAKQHGYTYFQGGEAYWDRTKPIAWSKIPFLLDICKRVPEGALIWQSDADVLITNPSYSIESQICPLLPEDKDMLLTLDACGHINSGNILFRNTEWSRSFWKRVGEMRQFTYHLWWENAAMCALYENVEADRKKIEVTRQHKNFNAYLRGIPDEPLWCPGDFLVHFAGVYDLKQMNDFAERCKRCEEVRIPMGEEEIQACQRSREHYLRYMSSPA
jgi:hypothetical protein